MSIDFQDLKLRIATLHAEELLEMVTFAAADYRSDALELARAELRKRGYSEADLQKWCESAGDRPAKNVGEPLARLRFVITLCLAGIVTFLLFAPLIYYSIIAYGIPSALFIGAGYLIWLALRQNDRQQARAFAIGFAGSVSMLLMAYSAAVPRYTGLIVGQCLFLWALFKIIRSRT